MTNWPPSATIKSEQRFWTAGTSITKVQNLRGFYGSLYLYTTELGTTPPPELGTSRLLYIRCRQNRLRYYMTNRTKVHHWLCRKMVLHGKQEYCTSQNKGILYITEIRNIVHHRKQEYCTSLKSGILYITEKKEFCTTQKTGILYNTEIRNIVHHWYDEECKWALCCCSIVWCTVAYCNGAA